VPKKKPNIDERLNNLKKLLKQTAVMQQGTRRQLRELNSSIIECRPRVTAAPVSPVGCHLE
jgi:hypothetical protein